MRFSLKNKQGKGSGEFILLMSLVVGLVILLLWNQIFSAVRNRVNGIGEDIAVVASNNPAAARQTARAATESESGSGSGGWFSNWFNTPSEGGRRGGGFSYGGGGGGGGRSNPEPSTGTFNYR
jgi:hypothetical protein